MRSPFLRDGEIKVVPQIGLRAVQVKLGGAWRCWTFARHLDAQGRGYVSQAALGAFVSTLGVHPRTWQNWIEQALDVGLLQESRVGADLIFRIASLHKAAAILGCEKVGRPATMPIHLLVKSGWRAQLFDAFNATLQSRPMSQTTKRRITGVKERTQRNYEKKTSGISLPNFAVTDLPVDQLTGIREHSHSHAFINREGKISWRLPNTRKVPESQCRPLPVGRCRKVQKCINLLLHGEQEPDRVAQRLYYETYTKAELAVRKIRRKGLRSQDRPGNVYAFIGKREGKSQWMIVPV